MSFPDDFFSLSLFIYLFVASMALGYRRLIDAGYSPWLLLFMLLGPIGSVILGFIEIFAPSIDIREPAEVKCSTGL